MAALPNVHAAGSDLLRVGLVGCGDRGTGAATQALCAESNVKLVAMADAFADRLQKSLEILQKDEKVAGKLDVKPDHRFVGFDAYRELLDSGVDVVLLCTPPHFRPQHLQAAVEAGKHVFAEKPVAVDAPGVHSVLASCELAKKKGLSVVSGLCLRYDNGFREAVRRIQDGAIGEVVALFANDYRSGRWAKPRQPDWTDMLYQMRNWYNFTWLSGDFNVEQHVHFLDVCAWVMKDQYPVKAVGMGGRQVLTEPEYGQIYDHFSVVYEYADGAKLVSNCRQQPRCKNDMSAQVVGTRGRAELSERRKGLQIKTQARHLDLRRAAEPDVSDRARRAVRQHPERQAHQQRRIHGKEHAAGDHGPHGGLHRAGDHLGDGAEVKGRPQSQPVRLGRPAPRRADRRAGADSVRLRNEVLRDHRLVGREARRSGRIPRET